MVGKARNVNQVAALADPLFVAQDEVKLAVEDESELLLVGMHVERGAFVFRLGDNSRLHEFADGGLDKLLRVCRAGVLLHLRNLVERHCLYLHVCQPV
jgi:hypothetical protein